MLRVLVLHIAGRGGVVVADTGVAVSKLFWRAVKHVFGIEVVAALGVAFIILSRLSLDSDEPVSSYATALSLGELNALTFTFVDTGTTILTAGLIDGGLLDTGADIGTASLTDT